MKFKFTDLLKESRILSEGRKEDALGKYPKIPEDVFNVFVENDPSGNHKYITWVTKVWWDGKCSRYSEGDYYWRHYCSNIANAESLMEDVGYFHEKGHKYEENAIDDFNDIGTFKSTTMDARLKMTKGELKKQAIKIFETDRYLVVEPTSHASSCYYGAGTRWCTTMKNSDQYFKQYVRTNSLLYFLNKKTGKKRAFLTPLGKPMFGPTRYGKKDWIYAGDKEYKNFTGQIFTETDNQGRSLRGIPGEARVAMQDAHKEKTKKWVKGLDDGRKKIELMTDLEMDGIPVITSMDYWDTQSGPIPDSVTEITGNLILRDGYDLGNLTKVGGQLNINREGNFTITNLETVDSIRIQDGNINLGSLTGTIDALTLETDGRLVNAGGVTKIGTLTLRNMNITKVLLNSIEIDNMHFTSTTAQMALSKVFRNSEIDVNRW